MSLAIERLRTRFHSSLPLPAGRRDDWLGAFAAADGDALSAGLVGNDEWLFIARLPVAMRWSFDTEVSAVGAQWQDELRRAIAQALAGEDDSLLIRYASRRAAIADMLYRSALGECSRQWAWQRMQLIARAGCSADAALAAGIALLASEPQQVWPVMHRLLLGERATAALSALLRALPAAAWSSLLAASPRTAAYASAVSAAKFSAGVASSSESASALADDPATRDWLPWAATRAPFAAEHLDILSVLLAALRWPAAGTSATVAGQRLAAVRAELRAAIGAAEPLRLGVRTPTAGEAARPATAPLAVAGAEVAGSSVRPLPPLPELPDVCAASVWQATGWGGLLFWLARLPASGALTWLAEQPELPADALPMLLRALADGLGVPADDAVRRAFCGGEEPAGEMPPPLVEYAATLADAWAAWLAEAAPELAIPRLPTVCRRRGRIRCEPGWIELALPLDSVDTSTRRLGLDLDPGWLPWLACVLRIRYD